MKTIAIASLAVLLSACAAGTPQQARDMGPERRVVFEVEADYQTTYRRIVEAARTCYQGMLNGSMTVNGDLYPDTRSGTVTVGLYGPFGPSLYQVIDIRGIDGARTEVMAAFPMGPVDKWGGKVRAWATATGTGC
jgi:hypothetical protein